MMSGTPISHSSMEGLPDFMTPGEAAALLRVSIRTVRRWISAGILNASQPNPRRGGRRWIAKSDLLRILGGN